MAGHGADARGFGDTSEPPFCSGRAVGHLRGMVPWGVGESVSGAHSHREANIWRIQNSGCPAGLPGFYGH